MRALWLIKSDIVDRYKDGDDLVYAKDKKAEIELIKELMELCTKYAQELETTREKLNEARAALRESEYYVYSVKNKLLGKEVKNT